MIVTVAVMLTLIIMVAINHILELYFQHDTIAIDVCILIGYFMYLFL